MGGKLWRGGARQRKKSGRVELGKGIARVD